MQQLDQHLRQATQDGIVPGAVICVAHRGEIVWHQAYGVSEFALQRRPMQRQTLFDIASLTKVVATTSLLLTAQHEGICRLDDCLQRFYPATKGTMLGAVTLQPVALA